jgi:hypothetical protein
MMLKSADRKIDRQSYGRYDHAFFVKDKDILTGIETAIFRLT